MQTSTGDRLIHSIVLTPRTRPVLGAALATGIAAVLLPGFAEPAAAQFFFSPYYDNSYYHRPAPPMFDEYAPRPRKRKPPKIVDDPKVRPLELPAGPLHVVVSIDKQRLTLFANGQSVAHSRISTGVASHPTPTGVFSVIQKRRYHESNLYSDAPMPFMQRITWSGIALHQGVLPGYPASHGCIRLPAAFAQQLWGATRIGARVIVARGEVAPAEIAHARLFAPKPKEEPVAVNSIPEGGKIALAATTRSDGPEVVAEAAKSEAVKPGATKPEGAKSDVKASEPTHTLAEVSFSAPETKVLAEPPAKASDPAPGAPKAADPARKPSPIAVFVSRKEGKLYVRQNFEPLFETPITIAEPGKPIGTHVFTAMEVIRDGAAMRWTVVTMPVDDHKMPVIMAERPSKKARARAEAEERAKPPIEAKVDPAAVAALDRIDIPKDALDRIAALLVPGSSLLVSDQGLGPETGQGTDFIVVTR